MSPTKCVRNRSGMSLNHKSGGQAVRLQRIAYRSSPTTPYSPSAVHDLLRHVHDRREDVDVLVGPAVFSE